MYDLTSAYKILGIGPNDSMAEIKRNYRELAKIYHPDNKDTGNAAKFRLLNEAFEKVKSTKPVHAQKEKPAPKREDPSRFNGKNRIYRILDKKNYKDGVYSVSFPFSKLDDRTVFHFMLDYQEFNLFIDKEISLPTTLDVTFKNKALRIKIYEGY